MKALIDKWIDKQNLFDEYVVKPACIHALVNNHVRRLHVWTGAFEDPEQITKTKANVCFVVDASSPAEPKLSESSSSGAGSSGDWSMLEKEEEAKKDRAKDDRGGVLHKVADLQKVTEEKQALVERLAELEVQQEELTGKTKGKAAVSSADVFDELQEKRRSRQEAKGTAASKTISAGGQDEDGAGPLWKNMKGASASVLTGLCKKGNQGLE